MQIILHFTLISCSLHLVFTELAYSVIVGMRKGTCPMQDYSLFETTNFNHFLELVRGMKDAASAGHFGAVQAGYRQALYESREYFSGSEAPRAISYFSLAEFYRNKGDEPGFNKVKSLLQDLLGV